jgi:hypothetical protein
MDTLVKGAPVRATMAASAPEPPARSEDEADWVVDLASGRIVRRRSAVYSEYGEGGLRPTTV